MVSAHSQLDWVTMPHWQNAGLVGFRTTGLLRFLLNGEVMFMSYAANAKTGLHARIQAYRSGAARKQPAGQQIWQHREQLELQFVVLALPDREIRDLCKAMVERDRPEWNAQHGYRGRY